MSNKTEVATIDSRLMATMQAALGVSSENDFVIDLAWHLENKRTLGVVVPSSIVDYRMFVPELMDHTINKLVIVPTLDNWVDIRDNFNHERKHTQSFRVFNEEGHVIDCYQLGSKAHLKLARTLKIDPNAREIVKTGDIHFIIHGVTREVPRGFSFESQAQSNNFVIRELMANYLGSVHMFNGVGQYININLEIVPLLDKSEHRVEMDLVVIYESRRFFDKVRKTKFYTWLSTQARPNTLVVLIN